MNGRYGRQIPLLIRGPVSSGLQDLQAQAEGAAFQKRDPLRVYFGEECRGDDQPRRPQNVTRRNCGEEAADARGKKVEEEAGRKLNRCIVSQLVAGRELNGRHNSADA